MSKDLVYGLLREKAGTYLSGEEISRRLGISRAAVWKAVDNLRRVGYTIDARSGLGYALVDAPDALTEREVRRCLEERGIPCSQLTCLEEVDSTNSFLKRSALEGAPHGSVAVANCQTGGRGRMARTFQSPRDRGVYLSILLRPALPPAELMPVTAMVAVAMCDAVEAACGLRPGIKWTNDLVVGKRKLGGILTEMALEGETGLVQYLISGTGINVLHTPEDFTPEVAAMATSLLQELGHPVSRPVLAAEMIRAFNRLGEDLGGDCSRYLSAYRRDCVTLGKQVQLLWQGDRREVVEALDIDDQFGLIVRRGDGRTEVIRSGEVSVRGMYGYIE